MKKVVSIILVSLLILSFCACGKTAESTAEKTYKIGICNYVDDASLNQIVASIESQLKALSDENVSFEILSDNCNADANVMSQIISNFESKNVDLMIGVATPVAMAMQSATEDSKTPVVFAAVSDPISVSLVSSLEKPGANVTGTSDYLDTTSIMNLITAYKNDIKKVGLLYDAGQDSSTTSIAEARKFFESKNIEVVEKTGTTVDEVTLAAQSLISSGVEAVFTPTDNTVMTAELSIYDLFANAGIPHFTGADSFALNGAFLGYGVDYENLGKETANMVYDILVGGKDIAETSVKTFDNGTATINTEICEKLGLDLNEIKTIFAPYCQKINEITTANSFDEAK